MIKFVRASVQYTQRIHDVMITSLLRQNDVATSFWRNDDISLASCVPWVFMIDCLVAKDTLYLTLTDELWGVFCEYLCENLPHYNGATLYLKS